MRANAMNSKFFRPLTLLALIASAAAHFPNIERASAQPPERIAADSESGEQLFARFGCYACHLYTGAGYRGAPGGAPLVPMRLSQQAFIIYLRNPPMPRRMPPYTVDVLSDKEAADIHAFIAALPEPPLVDDIPLLKEMLDEIGTQ